MTEQPLAILQELAQADTDRARELARLDELAAAVASVRGRAEAAASTLAAAAAARERAAAAVAAAEGDVVARRGTLAEAEAELVEAERRDDDERAAAANRFLVRARDALSVAERRLAASTEERAEVERRIQVAEADAPLLVSEAAALALDLRGRARLAAEAGAGPEPSLEGVSVWAGRARAALSVARSTLAAERDGLIRQANELGSVVLGEALAASTATAVARRVEQALEPRP